MPLERSSGPRDPSRQATDARTSGSRILDEFVDRGHRPRWRRGRSIETAPSVRTAAARTRGVVVAEPGHGRRRRPAVGRPARSGHRGRPPGRTARRRRPRRRSGDPRRARPRFGRADSRPSPGRPAPVRPARPGGPACRRDPGRSPGARAAFEDLLAEAGPERAHQAGGIPAPDGDADGGRGEGRADAQQEHLIEREPARRRPAAGSPR